MPLWLTAIMPLITKAAEGFVDRVWTNKKQTLIGAGLGAAVYEYLSMKLKEVGCDLDALALGPIIAGLIPVLVGSLGYDKPRVIVASATDKQEVPGPNSP